MRAGLLVLLVTMPALAGCFGGDDALDVLVPYPRYGDVATYDVTGAVIEFARWENGVAFPSGQGRARFTVAEIPDVLDGSRAIHSAFKVTSERDAGGGFVTKAERYVSLRHEAVVQSFHPLSQDQSIVAFDERGFPWLFGASALFGVDPTRDSLIEFRLPDNLGRGNDIILSWTYVGEERVDGERASRFDLGGTSSVVGTLWLREGSPWPLKARLEVLDDGLAPHVRTERVPAVMEAALAGVQRGSESLPGRDRSARFFEDDAVERSSWDGEKPPDGDPAYARYLLAEAVRDVKLLDQGLAAWLNTARDPRVYRATYQVDAGPVDGTVVPHWLVQFVDEGNTYYEVEVERVTLPQLGAGVPRVTRSGIAEAPADPNHGWFARSDAPDLLVPLSEGARIVRQVFGATGVQVFLRSFIDPAGYSYFLDGGFDDGVGRYTVVYNPGTGFIEQATGPVTPRFAP